MVCTVPVATNVYQTSSSIPVALHEGAVSVDCDAPTVVPVVVTPHAKSALTVSAIAPAQSSLAGGPELVVKQK